MLGAYYPGFLYLGESGTFAAGILTIQDARHTHAVDNITLIQQHTLVLNDLIHVQTLDTLALVEHKTLSIQDLLQGQSLDAISLTQAHTIALEDLQHGHTLETLALTQNHVLALADALHNHTLDAIIVVADDRLNISDLQHSQSLDTVTIGVYKKPDGPPIFIKRNVPRTDIVDEKGNVSIEKLLPKIGITSDAPRVGIDRVQIIVPGVANEIAPNVGITPEYAKGGVTTDRVDVMVPDSAPSFQFPDIDADASDVDADAPVDAGHSYSSRKKVPVAVASPEPRGTIVRPEPRWLN